jgi:uncharacterized protein YecE (DUF72 family)
VPLLVGTSGWQYRDWRGAFYPERLPVAQWLENYSTRFPAVENNGTFYRLASPETFAGWRSRTPTGFVMAIKASRYLTHVRRLREPAEPVARLLSSAASLADRLGPVLLQLPPTMQSDPRALDDCLGQFSAQWSALRAGASGTLRVCVEVRHPSWATQEVRDILEHHNAALCWSDRRGRPLGPLWRTADWGYLRLHEGASQPWPRYGRQALRTWLRRMSDSFAPEADMFAFFNNDQLAAATADAQELAALADRAAWPVAPPAPEGAAPPD